MLNKRTILTLLLLTTSLQSGAVFTDICNNIKAFFGYKSTIEDYGLWQATHTTQLTFDDVLGCDDAKNQLSIILRYLENPKDWSLSFSPSTIGPFLFSGPSRSGKSYLMHALYGEIHKISEKQGGTHTMKLFHTDVGYLRGKKTDLVQLRKFLLSHAPCVLCIDDVGMPILDDNFNFFSELCTACCSQLGVFIIGHTRKSIQQPGKWGTFIRFEYPNHENRKEYIVKKLDAFRSKYEIKYNKELTIDIVNADQLAHQTDGASYEDINAFVHGAYATHIMHNKPFNQELFEKVWIQEFSERVKCNTPDAR